VSIKLKYFAGVICFLFSGVLFADESRYSEVAGIALPSQVVVNDDKKPLVLNGAGIRYKFFFKIYIGALYLPRLESDPLKILSAPVPNRVSMHILYGEVPGEKLVDAWLEGFNNNLEATEYAHLEQRLGQFNQMFVTLHEGDEVLLDYIPELGTRVTIKNQIKGVIKGADFNRALLSVWLGDDPVTEELKLSLLGVDDD